jgi:hypothetical protein
MGRFVVTAAWEDPAHEEFAILLDLLGLAVGRKETI